MKPTARRKRIRVITVGKTAVCTRCKHIRECRDIRNNGKVVCFKCTTPLELSIYGRTLFGPSARN